MDLVNLVLKGSFIHKEFGEVKYNFTIDNYTVMSSSQNANLKFSFIDKILLFDRRKKSDKYEIYESTFSLEGISLKSKNIKVKRNKLTVLEPTKSYILDNIETYFEYAYSSYKVWIESQTEVKCSSTVNSLDDIVCYNKHNIQNKVTNGYEFNKRARQNNLHIT